MFLMLNKSRSRFLIVWFIENAYLRYLNVISFSAAFFIEVCIMPTLSFDIDMSCIVIIDLGIY